MASHQVIGIYSSVARARLAQEALIVDGMPEGRIAISVDFSEDGIAAEAPGQSYVNQPSDRGSGWFGSDSGNAREARHMDAVQRGACVVTVEARTSAEAHRIRDVMASLRPIDMKIPEVA